MHKCQHSLETEASSVPSQTLTQPLTQKEAGIRAQQIEKCDYLLYFSLPEKDPVYRGRVEVQLVVSEKAAAVSDRLFLDFSGGQVQAVHLNASSLGQTAGEGYHYDGNRISLPSKLFSKGFNTLVVDFTHPYGNSGFGFHRSQDPADGKFYMYSDFEPYNANKAFPNFDQPDLKATYTLVVDVPESWEVIANALESNIESMDAGVRRWLFPKTKPFSTYLFALIAGPFQKWESQTESGVPLRLFARESMAKYLAQDVRHWFMVTSEGFKFFENGFGYPYPFSKYDQILTPDYNHGAMENVGAVTFTEKYAFRTEPTSTQVLRRAETIVHELAHMWFGNLVTMKWWDDLWLNESFATYVSNLAMSKYEEKISSANVWQLFHGSNKEWAYREDDLVTTHPIVGTAADTEEALANFDGITYGKGASVLKQLVFYLGEEVFLTGLKSYFKKYEFKNATRTDFLAELSAASGKDLVAWEAEWFKASGTNSIEVSLESSQGKMKALQILQYPDEADHKLRTHRTEVGLYDRESSGRIVLRESVPVTYSGSKTLISEVSGMKAPAFVFPNVGDHDFVQVVLDPASLKVVEESLGSFEDPLLKQMLWSTLWEMVRHAKLPAQKFIKIAIDHLKNEKDLAVVQKGLQFLSGAPWYVHPKLRSAQQKKIEEFVSELFFKAENGSGMQISLFFKLVQVSKSAEGLTKLKKWLDQKEIGSHFQLDQERRWAILTRLSASGLNEALSLIQQEKLHDKNDKGVLAAMIAEAAFASEGNKKLWWKRLLNQDAEYPLLSIEKSRSVMAVFHDDDQMELTRFAADSFFEHLPHLNGKFPEEFCSSFAAYLYPQEVSEAMDRRIGDFLKANQKLAVGVTREVKKNRQLHQRTLLARALSGQVEG